MRNVLLRRMAFEARFPRAYKEKTMNSAKASVPTEKGSKYLQQLCKHWSHKLDVEFDQNHGTVRFPRDNRGAEWPGDAVLTIDAVEGSMEVRLDASSAEHLEALKGAVARHLDRFAFREAPLPFDWQAV